MQRTSVTEPTVVLIHGAGHTAAIWQATRQYLARPTLAVDLPGRADKLGDLASLSVVEASKSVAQDIRGGTRDEEVVLVGHSVAGTLLPSIASELVGRVRRLVFVAGVSAPEGQLPAEVFAPGQSEHFAAYLSKLRSRFVGLRLEDLERSVAHTLDSLSLSCEPMRWAGVPATMPRTFVRCLRDQIQSPEVQSRLIASCGAQHVVDIDSGHTPAVDAPDGLARLLSDIAAST